VEPVPAAVSELHMRTVARSEIGCGKSAFTEAVT